MEVPLQSPKGMRFRLAGGAPALRSISLTRGGAPRVRRPAGPGRCALQSDQSVQDGRRGQINTVPRTNSRISSAKKPGKPTVRPALDVVGQNRPQNQYVMPPRPPATQLTATEKAKVDRMNSDENVQESRHDCGLRNRRSPPNPGRGRVQRLRQVHAGVPSRLLVTGAAPPATIRQATRTNRPPPRTTETPRLNRVVQTMKAASETKNSPMMLARLRPTLRTIVVMSSGWGVGP